MRMQIRMAFMYLTSNALQPDACCKMQQASSLTFNKSTY